MHGLSISLPMPILLHDKARAEWISNNTPHYIASSASAISLLGNRSLAAPYSRKSLSLSLFHTGFAAAQRHPLPRADLAFISLFCGSLHTVADSRKPLLHALRGSQIALCEHLGTQGATARVISISGYSQHLMAAAGGIGILPSELHTRGQIGQAAAYRSGSNDTTEWRCAGLFCSSKRVRQPEMWCPSPPPSQPLNSRGRRCGP